jgi:hypothetical protein
VVIPGVLYKLRVTLIGGEAFSGKGLIGVTIPDTVTAIGQDGNGAFRDNHLAKVILGKGIKSIGNYTFSGNTPLTEIVIPDSVTEIGDGAFSNCGLTKLTLGKNVKIIGRGAFANNKLTELKLPAGLKELYGFEGNRITSLVIPNGVTIGLGFSNNPLTSVVIPNSLARQSWINRLGNPIKQNEPYAVMTSGIYSDSFKDCPLTRVIIPANMDERNMACFDANLVNYWKSQNKAAGAYVKNGPVWSK